MDKERDRWVKLWRKELNNFKLGIILETSVRKLHR
jgi:hypothetical protein